MKEKPQTLIFRNDNAGMMRRVTGESETLAHCLQRHGIWEIPEGVEFMRIRSQYWNAWIYNECYQVKIKIFEDYVED